MIVINGTSGALFVGLGEALALTGEYGEDTGETVGDESFIAHLIDSGCRYPAVDELVGLVVEAYRADDEKIFSLASCFPANDVLQSSVMLESRKGVVVTGG